MKTNSKKIIESFTIIAQPMSWNLNYSDRNKGAEYILSLLDELGQVITLPVNEEFFGLIGKNTKAQITMEIKIT